MKGQMSLEMIIGLMILLVVAAVVINLFLGQIRGVTGVKQYQNDLKYREFKAVCDGYCKTENYEAYCSEALLNRDLDGSPIVNAFPSEGTTKPLKFCEDAIYCFNVVDCEVEGGKVTPFICRQMLCKSWYDVFQSWSKAGIKVKELIPRSGSCVLKTDENWFIIGGFSKVNPCLD